MHTIVDIVILMENLIEYSKHFAKTSKKFRLYYKDDSNHNIRNSESLKFEAKIIGRTHLAGNINDVEMAMLLK